MNHVFCSWVLMYLQNTSDFLFVIRKYLLILQKYHHLTVLAFLKTWAFFFIIKSNFHQSWHKFCKKCHQLPALANLQACSMWWRGKLQIFRMITYWIFKPHLKHINFNDCSETEGKRRKVKLNQSKWCLGTTCVKDRMSEKLWEANWRQGFSRRWFCGWRWGASRQHTVFHPNCSINQNLSHSRRRHGDTPFTDLTQFVGKFS